MTVVYRFLLLSLLSMGLFAAPAEELPSQAELHDLMLGNWERIQDYEVDIKLSVDIPGFRMPTRKIHYMYKHPDKSKVEVKGFAIVPKQGIQPFFTFLRDSVDFQVVRDTVVSGKQVFEIALEDTFMNEAGTIGFYVEQETGNITQAWVKHDGQEFFRLNSQYVLVDGIHLPSSTQIKMSFPPDFENIQRLGMKPTQIKDFESRMTRDWQQGSIDIIFSKYKVNQGLPDHLFEDELKDAIQD